MLKREREAYKMGRKNFAGGKHFCPFPGSKGQNAERISWWNGYLDQRTHKRLGHIFEKHGLAWEFQA